MIKSQLTGDKGAGRRSITSRVIITHPRKLNKEFLKSVAEPFFRQGIHPAIIPRIELREKHMRYSTLLISIGGDGTFLRCAQLMHDGLSVPLLGINAAPDKSEGFYLQVPVTEIERTAGKLKRGEFYIEKLMRIAAVVKHGGKIKDSLVPALNEVAFLPIKPYKTGKYNIFLDGRTEFQISCGVLVSTPTGSTGWMRAAGGKIMKKSENKMQFIVREPYRGRLHNPQLCHGFFNDKMALKPFKDTMIAVSDSISKEMIVKAGDELVVSKGEPLKVVVIK